MSSNALSYTPSASRSPTSVVDYDALLSKGTFFKKSPSPSPSPSPSQNKSKSKSKSKSKEKQSTQKKTNTPTPPKTGWKKPDPRLFDNLRAQAPLGQDYEHKYKKCKKLQQQILQQNDKLTNTATKFMDDFKKLETENLELTKENLELKNTIKTLKNHRQSSNSRPKTAAADVRKTPSRARSARRLPRNNSAIKRQRFVDPKKIGENFENLKNK